MSIDELEGIKSSLSSPNISDQRLAIQIIKDQCTFWADHEIIEIYKVFLDPNGPVIQVQVGTLDVFWARVSSIYEWRIKSGLDVALTAAEYRVYTDI